MPAKLTQRLRMRLAHASRTQRLQVVVRFQAPARDRAPVPPASRSAEVARRQREVAEQIARVNGAMGFAACDVAQAAWIDRTCRAELDRTTIERLATCADVESVDLPGSILRE